jgi:hypothetical protein
MMTWECPCAAVGHRVLGAMTACTGMVFPVRVRPAFGAWGALVVQAGGK